MAGGRPTKPLSLVQGHITNSEKALRSKAESELLTGTCLKESPEVKNNKIAHKEFIRIKKLLKSVKKDDDLSGNIINTHCLLVAECRELEDTKQKFLDTLDRFEERAESENVEFVEAAKIKVAIQKQILDCDKALMSKRKMVLDIAKENVMTIQSILRSIPKPQEDKKQSRMNSFLEKRTGNGS